MREVPIEIKVKRIGRGYDAQIKVGTIIHRGWGLTPETATLDAFAVWRVSEKRKIDRSIVVRKE